ncbi:hypothetical protein BN14_07478 [Rhizoctonia solani AG-1 IB]|uniref:Transmembrane protein n=1 Tax=Thanatephorus cucumeris (strain AG1-IB / isolate 7/3/14) TaxID=1108050 RepID=M5C0D8_THACB|nr:hypothetical protein BN14_07478 [Rhizoctonia solani AG-1 IB]
MSSFIRFAGVAAVILSLGLFAAALPVIVGIDIVTPVGVDAVSCLFKRALLELDLVPKIKALSDCKTIAELELAAKPIVVVFQVCVNELLKIGAGVQVEADAKLSLIACVTGIITLLVQVLVQVCVKFGVAATLHLCAQIDAVVHLCLIHLDVCVAGIVALVFNGLGAVISLFVQVNLKLCLDVLVKASAALA